MTENMKIKIRDDFGILFNSFSFQKGVEIGVLRGDFSSKIRKFWKGELTLVDCWRHLENGYFSADDSHHNLIYVDVIQRFLEDRDIHIVRKFSEDAAKSFPDSYFDWVYIDADHSFEECFNDLVVWWPKLKIGGIFSGHDYFSGDKNFPFVKVKDAVDKFVSDKNIEVYSTEERLPSWYFFKE